MKRRDFIMLFSGAAAWPLSGLWPSLARAQNPLGAAQPAADPASGAGEVGQVGTLQGRATVTRGNAATVTPLQIGDPILRNDTLATGPNSTLGVTFDDQTTLSLSADTRIVVNEFVYQEGGAGNAATFNVAVGTAAFVASLVAKTGDMKITTPAVTLGIRGTTGIVDAGSGEVKLYPDANGHVGRIEVFNPQGAQLGALTQGATGFAIRPGPGGRLQAVPVQISPLEAARDRGLLQRLFVSHNIGRRMTIRRLRSRGFYRQRNRPGRMQQPFNRNPRGGGPGHPRRGNRNGR